MATEMIHDDTLDTEEMKKLYVRGIPKDATDEEFKEFFESHCEGSITNVAIIRKDGDQKKYTFGFVTFAESELIDKLLLKKEDLKFKGSTLNVNRAVPKILNNTPGAHERTKKLFIANVPKSGVTEDDLKKYFKERHPEEYGTIESLELVKKKDADGKKTDENKGFGFMTVSSEDMADKMCIQHHAGFELGGRKIELKKSSPPGEGGNRGGRGGQGGRGGRGGGKFADAGYGGGYGGGYDAGYGSGYGGGYGGGYAGGYGGYGAYGGYGGGYGQRFTPY